MPIFGAGDHRVQSDHPQLTPEQESSQVAASWYVLPKPPVPAGWLVFSDEFILRGLRGDAAGDSAARSAAPTGGQRTLLLLVRAAIACVQAVVMLLAYIPVVSQLMERFVTFAPRGALGALLRASYWKTRLRRLGQDTVIERGVEIWGAGNIEIGARSHIDGYARLAAGEAGYGQRGSIRIGDFTHVGPRAHLAGRGGLTIGDFVAIEACAHVYTATSTILDPRRPGQLLSLSHMPPAEFQNIHDAPVEIGDYAVIGFSSLVLPGAALGEGAIVHPYCVVASRFPAYANITGPGRARQNGWRRPLRPDPRKSSVPAAAAPGAGPA